MDTSQQFNQTLQQWADIFQRRSMHDFVLFAKKTGLSMSQFGTLMHLHHVGDCGVSTIAAHLGVTSAAASQLIERLVQQGLLARSEDPADRRGKQITITPQAEAFIQEAIRIRTRWMSDLSGFLTPGEQDAVTQALILLIRAEGQLPAEGHAQPEIAVQPEVAPQTSHPDKSGDK